MIPNMDKIEAKGDDHMQQHTIENIMSKSVISVSPEQSIEEAAQLMHQHNIGAIPVVENDRVTGMITDRDITIRSTADGGNEKMPVSQVMTNDVVTVSPNMSVEEAAQLMSQKQIRRLPVVENDHVIGMVALGDLATEEKHDAKAEEALTDISQPSRPTH